MESPVEQRELWALVPSGEEGHRLGDWGGHLEMWLGLAEGHSLVKMRPPRWAWGGEGSQPGHLVLGVTMNYPRWGWRGGSPSQDACCLGSGQGPQVGVERTPSQSSCCWEVCPESLSAHSG